jgi:hypothetical protein
MAKDKRANDFEHVGGRGLALVCFRELPLEEPAKPLGAGVGKRV